jgi:hypothetical protein
MLPQVPQTRRWPALRTELSLKSPPPTHNCAAQWSGGVASMRERQVRVVVHGSGVSQVPTQLGCKKRGWCGPPLGPQLQYAGQCGDQG